jgi:CheY-like chemotaxis protein
MPEIIINKLGENHSCTHELQLIQNSGEKAAAVVADLLTIARGVASKKEAIALDGVVCEYLNSPEFAKLKANYPKVQLKTDLTVKERFIWGSEIHIRKSLMNLVTNAFETLEEKGTVTVKTKFKHLDKEFLGYQTIPAGNYIVLEIADTGKGMSQEVMERVFEPFFTRKQMGMSGTGLGLAIVWNTMQNHKGYIDLKSEIGIGTSFELYFPMSNKVLKEMNKPTGLSDLKGNEETILVVDDEEIQRTIATEILSDLNYKVISVSSGEEAVNMVKESKFDLILLDMIIPNGISGKVTYEKIKEIYPSQKAIVITGLSSSKDAEYTLKMGAGSLITKPYSVRELALAVKKELTKK